MTECYVVPLVHELVEADRISLKYTYGKHTVLLNINTKCPLTISHSPAKVGPETRVYEY